MCVCVQKKGEYSKSMERQKEKKRDVLRSTLGQFILLRQACKIDEHRKFQRIISVQAAWYKT